MVNKALFLDRDGTLNEDKGYTFKVSDLQLKDGVVEGLKKFIKHEYILIVITNQSGVGRGFFSKNDMDQFNDALAERLLENGIEIKQFYVCPHSPEENCSCRKPSPYMLLQAKNDWNIELDKSIMLGDKSTDIKCGQNAGVMSYLVTEQHDIHYWANYLLGDD